MGCLVWFGFFLVGCCVVCLFFFLICRSECLLMQDREPGQLETVCYSIGPSEKLLHSFPAARAKTPASNIENRG